MENIRLTLIHGKNKHLLEIAPNASLSDLLGFSEDLTGVPAASQKLISNAKTLTSPEPDKITLSELKIKTGAKIMVLGRKFDPEKDEAYQKILAIEKRSFEISQKLAEAAQQVQDIENGHLPREHHAEALRGLNKRCKGCAEEWMRVLETLDGTQLEESQSMAKSKRKSLVNNTNANLDRADELVQRIEDLLSKST